MKDKFLLKIPRNILDLSKGYQESRFKTLSEIANYLEVSVHTVRAMVEGTAKFAVAKTKYLQHIKIEKLETKVREFLPPKTEEEVKIRLEQLISKAKRVNEESVYEEIDCKESESVIERVCSE